MNIFGKSKESFESHPGLLGKIELLFKDVEIEGKKQGYDKASKEYEKVYQEIETEFLETKRVIENQKNDYDNNVDILIKKLESLEIVKNKLEQQVYSTIQDLSNKYDLNFVEVRSALNSERLIGDRSQVLDTVLDMSYKLRKNEIIRDLKIKAIGGELVRFSPFHFNALLDFLYKRKQKKLIAAEESGYVEARELYDKKISKLKSEHKVLKQGSENTIQELIALIYDIFEAITDVQTDIAELKILLEGIS